MLAASTEIVIREASATAEAVTLPASPVAWQQYTVKDGDGFTSATYPITVSPPTGTIDGKPSMVMTTPYQALTFVYDGTAWNAQ